MLAPNPYLQAEPMQCGEMDRHRYIRARQSLGQTRTLDSAEPTTSMLPTFVGLLLLAVKSHCTYRVLLSSLTTAPYTNRSSPVL